MFVYAIYRELDGGHYYNFMTKFWQRNLNFECLCGYDRSNWIKLNTEFEHAKVVKFQLESVDDE
jgi:hypothetical protein